MAFRVRIPGYGDVYVFAPNQQEAIVKAQQWMNQNGIQTGSEGGSFTATPFSAGSIPPSATRIGFGATAQPTTGPGSPTEEQNNPSGFAPQDPVGPDIGAGDDSDVPDDESTTAPLPTNAFWRVNIPGYGNVYFSGTREQATAAAFQFTQQSGLEGPFPEDGFSPVATSQSNFNTGLRVGVDGTVMGGLEGSWLEQLQQAAQGGAGDDPTGGTGDPTPPGNGQGPAGTTPEDQTPTAGPNPTGITDEDASTIGTFRNFLASEGLDPNSVLGETAQRQFNPAFSAFALGQLVNNFDQALPTGENGAQITGGDALAQQFSGGPQRFHDFLGAGGINQSAQLGMDALRSIVEGPSALADTVGDVLSGARPGSEAGQVLEGATLAALRSILSPSVANLFGSQLIQQGRLGFEDALAAGAPRNESPGYAAFLLQSVLGR